MANLTNPRYSACALEWQTEIIVTGGSMERTGGQGTVDLNTVEVFIPQSGSSRLMPNMKFARRHHACQVTDGPGGRKGNKAIPRAHCHVD